MLHPTYSHEVCRKWMVNLPTPDQIVYPIFVLDQENAKEEISSMPGVARYGYKNIVDHLEPLVNKLGLQSILMFGVIDNAKKDEVGTFAGTLDESVEGPVHKAIANIKKAFPKLMIIADVCMCSYTTHGHCGVINTEIGKLNNQVSIERLGEVAVSYARKGADMVAPSDMMDNRVKEIKDQLKKYNFSHIPVMSYSAKFASAYYGPFRDVCNSAPQYFDRSTYQLPLDSKELAIRAVERDLQEGADFIIVKPLLNYLDIAAKIKERYPQSILAGYQVSGEYAFVEFSSKNGGCDKKKMLMEQLRCYKRAGIDIVITYYAPIILEWLRDQYKA